MKPVILINGIATEPDTSADIVETESGIFSVLSGGRVFEVRTDGPLLTIAGQRIETEIDDPRAFKQGTGAAGAHGRAALLAAMPGKVVRVLVTAGDEVTQGQPILVVEAMKMQNEMKSPRNGRVISIDVREGDSVTAGAQLAAIE